MQFYPIQLRLTVRGCDRSADGVLAIQLPCPPSVGLHIADIYSQEPLYVDDVTVSAVAHTITVWCSTISEEDTECHVVTRCFVGEWSWTYYATPPPDEDGEDGGEHEDEPTHPTPPESDEQPTPASDEWYEKMRDNAFKRRGTTTGDN